MEQSKNKKQWTFTGKHMLIIIVSFFTVVFGMNIFMAISAKNSWTGLVVKNTYVASQEYNKKLATTKAQHDRGWTSSVDFKDNKLIFSLRDKNNEAIDAKEVKLQVNRVIGTEGELHLILQNNENGDYSSPAILRDGIWNIFIVAILNNGENFEHYYQIKVE